MLPTDREAVPTLKVVLLGDLGVGKTCLRSQFVHHIFTNAYKATIGGDYLTTTVELQQDTQSLPGQALPTADALDHAGQEPVEPQRHTTASLQIWDTAGQERFNLISQAFYRGADVAVLVYDVTNYESVLSIRDWFARFMQHCHVEKPGVVLVGNKSDKTADRCVDREEIRAVLCRNDPAVSLDNYVGDWDRDLLEISCKQLPLVEEVFQRVAAIGLALDRKPTMVGFDGIDLAAAKTASPCAC